MINVRRKSLFMTDIYYKFPSHRVREWLQKVEEGRCCHDFSRVAHLRIWHDDGSSKRTWMTYGSYACWGLAGLFSLFILCLFNSIRIAAAVMKTSAVFIAHNMRTILVPFLSFLFTAAFLAFWVIDAAYLSSSGKVVASTGGTQYRQLVWDDTLRYMMIYQLFGLLWVAAMIISCTQFVIIVCACVWYFTSSSDTRG